MDPTRVAAAIVALEGAAGVVAGAGFAVTALAGHPDDRGTAVLLGVLLALYGVGMLLVARGVHRHRRWARTPAYLIQFFALVVAWYNRDSTIAAVSIALAVVALVAVVALIWAQGTDDVEA
jgi:hypothetical protein